MCVCVCVCFLFSCHKLFVCLSVSLSRLAVACLLVSFLLSLWAAALGFPALGSWSSSSWSDFSPGPALGLQSQVLLRLTRAVSLSGRAAEPL